MWDLFCGVGGFGLHCATPDMQLTGIEIAPEAIACAKQSAAELGLTRLQFQALDSTQFATAQGEVPELVLVNPPRQIPLHRRCVRTTTGCIPSLPSA